MNKKIFDQFPILQTARLILRRIEKKDAPPIFEFNSGVDTMKYVPRDLLTEKDQGLERTNGFIQGFDEKTAIWWAFTYKSSADPDQLIGYGGFFDINFQQQSAELGYGLLKPYWGQGIMSEAVAEFLNFGLNKLKLNRIVAYIDIENTASIRVIEKFNFVKEETAKSNLFIRNRCFNLALYVLNSNGC